MGYEYQNKKAPLASLEEDFEEINDNDTGMDYEPAFSHKPVAVGQNPIWMGYSRDYWRGTKQINLMNSRSSANMAIT